MGIGFQSFHYLLFLTRRFVCLLCFLCLVASSAESDSSLIRFAVIGDSGSGDEHQARVAAQMARWHERYPYSLVLMLGDNIYGAWGGGGNKKYFEEKFDRPYAKLLARRVTFRAALGNHDTRHRDGKDLIDAYDRFHIDGPLGYYSFTAGESGPVAPATGTGRANAEPLLEFFVLNTMRLEEEKKDPEQLAWLEDALGKSKARWRIVYGHHPMYSTGKRHGADQKLRAKVEPLLEATLAPSSSSPVGPATGSASPRVHVVFAGHDHIYQRFHPQNGVVYFVCGSSGKLRRGNARPDATVAAVEDQQRVFMLWEATLERLRFQAINEQGQAFDCGSIDRTGRVVAVPCPVLAGGFEPNG